MSPATDQAAQDEARAEPPRGGERGVRVVAKIRVDFRLRDLAAYLLRRVRPQPERLQPLVDRLVVRAVILLLRLDDPFDRRSPIITMIFVLARWTTTTDATEPVNEETYHVLLMHVHS